MRLIASHALVIFSFIFLALLLPLNSVSSTDYSMPFTGYVFDHSILHDLKNKNVNQVIQKIRDLGVIVILLEKPTAGHKKNSQLIIHNTVGNKVLSEYTKLDRSFQPQSSYGYYIPPYSHLDLGSNHNDDNSDNKFDISKLTEARIKKNKSRTFFDRDVIVLRSNANREVAIHEFIHYLIHQKRNKKSINISKLGKIDVKTFTAIASSQSRVHYLETKEKFSAILKQYRTSKKTAALIAEVQKITKEYPLAWIKMKNLNLDNLFTYLGEEIDLCLYLITYAKQLQLTQSEIDNSMIYLKYSLIILMDFIDDTKVDPMYSFTNSHNDKNIKNTSNEVTNRIAALDFRVNRVNQWIKAVESGNIQEIAFSK